MESQININEIYQHNLNFIIGSGASYGLFPTLSLKMRNNDTAYTIETLGTEIERSTSSNKRQLNTLLFMHYFESCIKPIMEFDIESPNVPEVIKNYEIFITTLLVILNKKRSLERRCNLFTTNYDGCFALIADKVLRQGKSEFVINDGTRGFGKRYLQVRNFNSYICRTGIFERYHTDIPQINLIHLHGSVYWFKQNESIVVDYQKPFNERILPKVISNINEFSNLLNTESTTFSDLERYANTHNSDLINEAIDHFWNNYDQLPIVNPTKWKFQETVFEEHYYQMLRAMSYELEKPNTIFISFGFSFADEHILNLVKRSLSNLQLRLFICCFNEAEKAAMQEKFSGHENIQYITHTSNLDFTAFNEYIFTFQPKQAEPELEEL